MILKTRQAGDPILRKKAKAVPAKDISGAAVQSLIDYMIETLRDTQGVGLAAPQVGEGVQIVIIEDLAKYHKKLPKKVLNEQGRKPVKLHVIINPKLKTIDDETARFFEGCLSIEGYRALVDRHKSVAVEGLDRRGKPISFTASGWLARILEHEIDHLSGKLYIDKMHNKSFMTDKNFSKDWADKVAASFKPLTD